MTARGGGGRGSRGRPCADLRGGAGEEGRGAVEEQRRVRLLLALAAVVPRVRHAVVAHHHQQGVVLQTLHHRPAGGAHTQQDGLTGWRTNIIPTHPLGVLTCADV